MAAYAVLCLDDLRIALPLGCVERAERAMAVNRLPAAPAIVLGVIDVHGRVVPVIDMRARFRLPPRPIGVYDRIVVAATARRAVALVADAVEGVVDCDEAALVAADRVVPGLEFVRSIARRDDGLILIHDLDGFLSLDEEAALDRALAETAS